MNIKNQNTLPVPEVSFHTWEKNVILNTDFQPSQLEL